jgi:hypothetical protein
MKKYIFTENQIKKIIDNQLNEQIVPKKDCFSMAFDNSKTTFDNGVIRNGDLTFSSEMNTYRCGKVSRLTTATGPGSIVIDKKNGVSSVIMYQNGKPTQIKFEPNCSCTKI